MKHLTSFLGCYSSSDELRRLIEELGVKPEIETIEDRTYWEMKRSGISLVFDANERLITMHFYCNDRDGYEQFSGELPANLFFQDGKDEVHAKLGSPTRSGGGEIIPILGKTLLWDLYEKDNYLIHIEYSGNGISLCSISPK